MSLIKRLFSADFRRAVAAEAAGDYDEAARAYALAGERAKVGEMHLCRAERAPSPEAKLHELRASLRWADRDDPDGREVRRRAARAMLLWAKQAGLVSEADRQVVRDAAALFAEVSDHAGAAEAHELVGDELAAAEAYQRAGDVERLESVLAREEARRKHARQTAESFEDYRLHLAGGERDRALDAIRACAADASDGQRAEYRRLCDTLEHNLVTGGVVRLRAGGGEVLYAGAWPLVLGREPSCQVVLRDQGISRRHAEIVLGEGAFALRDLGSRNGSSLGGVPLQPGSTLPLAGAGVFGLGELCTIGFSAAPPRLELTVTGGLDRGLRVVASSAPIAVGEAELRFSGGRPRLSARRPIVLNQVVTGGAVQLIRGDVIELGQERIEVL